jgi:hypothetical protein
MNEPDPNLITDEEFLRAGLGRKPKMNDTTYLGDSVYIQRPRHGFGEFVLFLNNGGSDATGQPLRKSEIILEPETAIALYAFLKKTLNL